MKSRVLLRCIPVLVGALAVGACGGSVEAGPATAQNAAAATKAPLATPIQLGHLKVVADALAEVPLRPDQRSAIEQLASDAQVRHTATKQARVDVANALAAQIEAGKIDRAALQPKIDAVAETVRTSQPADRAAFEKLHAILDKDQRSAFVDALVAKAHAQHGMHGGREHLQKLAADLKLTDDQRAQIGSILRDQWKGHHAEGKEGHEKGKAMLEAFKQDRFVMDEVAPAADAHEKANAMSARFLDMAEKVLPILTPEQRVLAANKVRERAGEMELGPQ